jgi:DNA-binding NtrC family response regulator
MHKETMKYASICVDDEISVLDGLRQELSRELGKNYLVEVADSAEEALDLLDELIEEGFTAPVIISDQLMPGMKGDEFLIEVNRRLPEIKKILLSGQAPEDAIQRAFQEGSLFRYLQKPWESQTLTPTVLDAISIYRS